MTEEELTAAIAHNPDDADAIAVYGDWLADRGDPLGEYIGVSRKLEDVEGPDRMSLLARSYELRDAHEAAWLARWNDPYPLFSGPPYRFCGLPYLVDLDAVPPDLAALERQVARLPIHILMFHINDVEQIKRFTDLPLLRRIRSLSFLSKYPGKLGDELVPWVAGLALANLTRLGLCDVHVRTADIQPLCAGLPKLTSLSLYETRVAHDVVAELSASTVTQHLEQLSVTRTPIGNAMVAALSAWPALRGIDLAGSGIDDTIAELPVVELPITRLDIASTRLGRDGAAWLVRAMPKLVSLELSDDVAAATAGAFVPIAHQLESIDVAHARDDQGAEHVIGLIVPHSTKLRRLALRGICRGLARDAISPELHELGLHGLRDDDLAVIAESPRAGSLRYLDVQGDDLTDEGFARLARSPHLTGLRRLTVSSRAATERGLAHVLAAPWPLLECIFAINVPIEDAAPLDVHRPALELDLYHCSIEPDVVARLRRVWGVRLRWTPPE